MEILLSIIYLDIIGFNSNSDANTKPRKMNPYPWHRMMIFKAKWKFLVIFKPPGLSTSSQSFC